MGLKGPLQEQVDYHGADAEGDGFCDILTDGVAQQDLYACPSSRRFFALYQARVDIEEGTCTDSRSFLCPSCSERLRINSAGSKPVATCPACGWTTDEVGGISSIRDMLKAEATPFPDAEKEFKRLVLLASGSSETLPAAEEIANEDWGLMTKVTSSAPDGGKRRDGLPPAEFEGPYSLACLQRRGCSDTCTVECSVCGHGKPAVVDEKDMLPLTDMLSPRVRSRRQLPPKRPTTESMVLVYSPISSKLACKGTSVDTLQHAPLSGKSLLPQVTARASVTQPQTILLTLRNATEHDLSITLNVDNTENAGTQETSSAAWLDGNTVDIAPEAVGKLVLKTASRYVRVHEMITVTSPLDIPELEGACRDFTTCFSVSLPTRRNVQKIS